MATVLSLGLFGCGKSLDSELLRSVPDYDLTPRGPQHTRDTVISGTAGGDALTRPQLYPGERSYPNKRLAVKRPGVSSSGGGYQVSFDNAKLSVVSKVILGDTLRLPYIFDPRVQGSVTVSTGQPVSRDELLSVLEVVLKMNNAALVTDTTGYRILPLGEAQGAGNAAGVSVATPGKRVEPGYGVSILPMRHVSAPSMLTMLEGFLAKAGSVRAEVSNNLLLVRGTSAEREAVIDVAATFDIDWLRNQSAGIFPLASTAPQDMISELQKVFKTGENQVGAKLIQFEPIARLNAVLVITKSEKLLYDARTWINRLDRGNGSGADIHVYQVENGKAVELASLLNETFGDSGSGQSTARAQIRPGSEVAVSKTAKTTTTANGVQTLSTQVAKTQTSAGTTGSSGRIVQSHRGGGGGGGSIKIVADEVNNALIIRASRHDYRRIRAVLRRIDRAPLQVLITATIAEVTLNDNLRYGVQVFLRSSDLGLGKDNGSIGVFKKATELLLSPSFPGLNFILGAQDDPRAILDALSTLTKVKVVSSPSVVVIDNQEAKLQVGNEVPITTQQAQSTQNPDSPILNTIQFRNTGVILKVVPRVNSSGLVNMEIEQEISNVVSSTGTGGSLTPTIAQRKIASTISVYSGQTVVLGGLISERKNKDKERVPVVDRIPFFGDVIGHTEKTGERTELIVFIKPQVIRDGVDASVVAEELRSRLRSLSDNSAEEDIRSWRTHTYD